MFTGVIIWTRDFTEIDKIDLTGVILLWLGWLLTVASWVYIFTCLLIHQVNQTWFKRRFTKDIFEKYQMQILIIWLGQTLFDNYHSYYLQNNFHSWHIIDMSCRSNRFRHRSMSSCSFPTTFMIESMSIHPDFVGTITELID